MKSRLIATGLAIVGYAIIDATPANAATTYTWDGGCNSTAWSCVNNWVGNSGYPGSAADDSAIVPSATYEPVLDVDLSGASAPYPIASLEIQKDAIVDVSTHSMYIDGAGTSALTRLDIDPVGDGDQPGELRVSGTNGLVVLTGGGEHYINGKMVLTGSGATLSITTYDVILSGSGFIAGQHEDSDIIIAASKQLDNRIDIMGILDIEGAGTFLNSSTGAVIADLAGTLDVVMAGTVDDDGSASWQVTASNANLRFASSIGTVTNPLVCEFVVSNGTFVIDKPLTNTHRLSISGGIFDVNQTTTMGSEAVGKHLDFNADDGGGEIDVASGVVFTHN